MTPFIKKGYRRILEKCYQCLALGEGVGGWEQGDFLLCIAFAFEFQIMCIYYYSKILSNQIRKERREQGESKRDRDQEKKGRERRQGEREGGRGKGW